MRVTDTDLVETYRHRATRDIFCNILDFFPVQRVNHGDTRHQRDRTNIKVEVHSEINLARCEAGILQHKA